MKTILITIYFTLMSIFSTLAFAGVPEYTNPKLSIKTVCSNFTKKIRKNALKKAKKKSKKRITKHYKK